MCELLNGPASTSLCVAAAGAHGVTANVGFLAMAYWRYSGKEGKLRCWALSQVSVCTLLTW